MTLDQIVLMLADRKLLIRRTRQVDAIAAASLASKDGFIKGRSVDGKVIYARIEGKSLASKLIEQAKQRKMDEEKRTREEQSVKPKSRRRRGAR